MRLEELSQHTPDQTSKINELVGVPDFFIKPTPRIAAWAQVKDYFWGKELELSQSEAQEAREEEDDESLPNVGPTTQLVVKIPQAILKIWRPISSHILVRSEYEEAEQAALKANASGFDAFLVGGQSGIGKSMFLIWLLMKRLSLKLPTALQVEKGHAILFHDGGTSQFASVTDAVGYTELIFDDPSSRIWALVDSNSDLLEPAPIFRMHGPFFVIGVASRQNHFEWAKKVYRQHFYMKTWAFSEVLQARPYFKLGPSLGGPYEEPQLRYLYETYRAPPRALIMYTRDPAQYEAQIVEQVKNINPDSLRFALRSPDSDHSSHLIIRMEPSPTERFSYQKTIASGGVLKLLWDQYLKNSAAEIRHLYTTFQGSPVTASAAGGIFELQMHKLFRQGYSLKLFPLRSGSTTAKCDVYSNYTNSNKQRELRLHQLTVSEEHPLDDRAQLEINCYYRPSSNFPTIDSLLLIHPDGDPSPILLLFQMTRNKEKHYVKLSGLEKVNNLGFPPNTRKYYVAVTPLGIEPRIEIPKGRFVGAVFHHPVDDDTLFELGAIKTQWY